jgi:hypothetical protein
VVLILQWTVDHSILFKHCWLLHVALLGTNVRTAYLAEMGSLQVKWIYAPRYVGWPLMHRSVLPDQMSNIFLRFNWPPQPSQVHLFYRLQFGACLFYVLSYFSLSDLCMVPSSVSMGRKNAASM